MLEETTPIKFAIGTAIDVKTIRLFSEAILLLYQTSRRTEGAEVPQVIMKQAKYAAWDLMSTAEKMMKPIKVKANPAATKGNLKRVKSDEKARMRSMTAPETFGATV